MSVAFDTLAAARDLENAGLERPVAEAVASAIRAGQGELVTKADLRAEISRLDGRLDGFGRRLDGFGSRLDGLQSRINGLQWVIGVNLAISLATLAGVLAMAFRP